MYLLVFYYSYVIALSHTGSDIIKREAKNTSGEIIVKMLG